VVHPCPLAFGEPVALSEPRRQVHIGAKQPGVAAGRDDGTEPQAQRLRVWPDRLDGSILSGAAAMMAAWRRAA